MSAVLALTLLITRLNANERRRILIIPWNSFQSDIFSELQKKYSALDFYLTIS